MRSQTVRILCAATYDPFCTRPAKPTLVEEQPGSALSALCESGRRQRSQVRRKSGLAESAAASQVVIGSPQWADSSIATERVKRRGADVPCDCAEAMPICDQFDGDCVPDVASQYGRRRDFTLGADQVSELTSNCRKPGTTNRPSRKILPVDRCSTPLELHPGREPWGLLRHT